MFLRARIIVLLTLTAVGGFCQRYNFTQYFIDKGLSQSQVTDLKIDNLGYLWIATDGGGLDYFDGINFYNINQEQGLSFGRITSLAVTKENYIICGVRQNFFSIIFPDSIVNYNTNINVANTTVSAIIIDSPNGILLGNDAGDIYYLDSTWEPKHFLHLDIPITSLCFSNETLYIGTNQGLYTKKGQTIERVQFLENLKINTITTNKQNTIFVGTERGMFYSKFGKWVRHDYFSQQITTPITKIILSDEKQIWISTYGNGVFLYDGNSLISLNNRNGLQNNFCKTILLDSSGNLWIGTDGSGLIKYSGNRFSHYFKSDKSFLDPVMSIVQTSDERYWLGTFGSGIALVGKSGECTPFANNHLLPSKIIYSLLPVTPNQLLVSSKYSEVAIINTQTNKISLFQDKNGKLVRGVVIAKKDSQGALYLGTFDDGLFIFKDGVQVHLKDNLPSSRITTLTLSQPGKLWIGTEDGGAFTIELSEIYKALGGEIKPSEIFPEPLSFIKRTMVTGIDSDLKGNIWLGTFGHGVYCIKSDNSFTHFGKSDGMLSNNVYSLMSDNTGVIWLGTDRGVNKLIIDHENNKFSFISYDAQNGFPAMECNINALFVDNKNRMWIGNIYGVSVYNPMGYATRSSEIQIHFTNILTYKNESKSKVLSYFVSNLDPIELPYSENNITFYFKAIDINSPDKVTYQFHMEGLDNEWQSSRLGIAQYSFLPPGKYTFRARAINKEGFNSSNQLSINIIVDAPFWLTPWFIGIIFLSIIVLWAIIFRYRQYALIRHNRLLQELVENRTLELKLETIRVQQQTEEIRTQAENLRLINQELKKLSIIASKTDSAVLIANKNFEWEWANEGFTKLYGYTLDEFIARYGRTIQQTSFTRKIDHIIEEALSQQKSVVYTAKVYNAAGGEMWVQSTLTPIYDDNGDLQMIVVIDADITHIKQINNELRKLSLVASKTDNAVIIMNKHGEIEWVNEGFHRMYELSLDDFKNLYGTTIFELHRDAKSLKQIQELYQTNQTQTFVSKFITSRGNEKWIQTVLTPIISPGQQYEQLIAVESDITRIKQAEEQLALEKEKSDTLLKNILPQEIAEELKSKGHATPRYYKSVTILFTDIKGFSGFCQNLTPQQLLNELHEYFDAFDEIVKQNYVEKIKTIGDAYMCAGGLPIPNRSHPFNVVLTGLQIQQVAGRINRKKEAEGRTAWHFRVGIHTGEIISGVIGKQKFAFDIWGDSVNVAARMESSCEPGMVNISGETYKLVKDYFECEHRGKIEIKNRGKVDMYFVKAIKAEYSENGDGITPNEQFRLFLAEL